MASVCVGCGGKVTTWMSFANLCFKGRHGLNVSSYSQSRIFGRSNAPEHGMNTHGVHITDYKVLEADDAEELSREVLKAIHNRWQPFGDMAVANTHNASEERVRLLQPIVQHAEWFR